jgi:hypothetical protein
MPAASIENDHGGMAASAVGLRNHFAVMFIHIQFLKGDTISVLGFQPIHDGRYLFSGWSGRIPEVDEGWFSCNQPSRRGDGVVGVATRTGH